VTARLPHRVIVVAAIVERNGTYLATRRLQGTHLAGLWEFPGGKCERGETHAACLEREIREELGCAITVGEKVLAVAHDYDDRRVELHFFRTTLHGEPRAVLGQEIRWVPAADLRRLAFPPADEALIRLLTT